MSHFGLQETDMKVPCSTYQCFGRAAYYLGKEDSPNGTVPYICEECAQELRDQIINKVIPTLEKVESPEVELMPFEPDAPVYEIQPEDKVVDLESLSFLKLKSMAKEMKIEGYSDKSKAELIELIKKETNIEAVVE
jgi:hypothetical protein